MHFNFCSDQNYVAASSKVYGQNHLISLCNAPVRWLVELKRKGKRRTLERKGKTLISHRLYIDNPFRQPSIKLMRQFTSSFSDAPLHSTPLGRPVQIRACLLSLYRITTKHTENNHRHFETWQAKRENPSTCINLQSRQTLRGPPQQPLQCTARTRLLMGLFSQMYRLLKKPPKERHRQQDNHAMQSTDTLHRVCNSHLKHPQPASSPARQAP